MSASPPDETPHASSDSARPRGWRGLALVAFVSAGVLMVSSAVTAGGTDLRAAGVTDLATLVQQQRTETDALVDRAADLDRRVSALSRRGGGPANSRLQRHIAQLKPRAGLTQVRGPGVEVVLDDAPNDVIDRAVAEGVIPPELLIVHQQDIQAVVNALWEGGARAISVMDQRVISTTGIKCVGNTVILHKVPYSPPYRIKAVGSVAGLERGLRSSDYVTTYRSNARDYGLGWSSRPLSRLAIPAYAGVVTLEHARPMSLSPESGRD